MHDVSTLAIVKTTSIHMAKSLATLTLFAIVINIMHGKRKYINNINNISTNYTITN